VSAAFSRVVSFVLFSLRQGGEGRKLIAERSDLAVTALSA